MKYRLSKLQKWILVKCGETINARKDMFRNGFLFRVEIRDGYFGKGDSKGDVSVSRSLRTLINNGYLAGYTSRLVEDPSITKMNPMDMLKKHPKLDELTLLAVKFSKDKLGQDAFMKAQDELLSKHNKSDKLVSPVYYKHETIKLVALTDLGLKTALMLSMEKTTELNNKTDVFTAVKTTL